MSKSFLRLAAVISLGALLVAACNLYLVTSLPTPVAPTHIVTTATNTLMPVPPATDTAVPTPQAFAPACPPCPAPELKDTAPNETYCIKKVPYQNFSVEPGAKFVPLDTLGGLICADSGTTREVNGRKLKVWSCTSKPLWSSMLKVTAPACATRMVLKLDPSRCPAGLMYSAEQNCCISLMNNDAESVTIKINMGACK